MTEHEHPARDEEEYWQHDLAIGEAAVAGEVSTVRLRLHVAEDRVRGREAFPAWSPDGERLVYFAERDGTGSVWVTGIDAPSGPSATPRPRPRRLVRRGRGTRTRSTGVNAIAFFDPCALHTA